LAGGELQAFCDLPIILLTAVDDEETTTCHRRSRRDYIVSQFCPRERRGFGASCAARRRPASSGLWRGSTRGRGEPPAAAAAPMGWRPSYGSNPRSCTLWRNLGTTVRSDHLRRVYPTEGSRIPARARTVCAKLERHPDTDGPGHRAWRGCQPPAERERQEPFRPRPRVTDTARSIRDNESSRRGGRARPAPRHSTAEGANDEGCWHLPDQANGRAVACEDSATPDIARPPSSRSPQHSPKGARRQYAELVDAFATASAQHPCYGRYRRLDSPPPSRRALAEGRQPEHRGATPGSAAGAVEQAPGGSIELLGPAEFITLAEERQVVEAIRGVAAVLSSPGSARHRRRCVALLGKTLPLVQRPLTKASTAAVVAAPHISTQRRPSSANPAAVVANEPARSRASSRR
jgi:hypothetical protein